MINSVGFLRNENYILQLKKLDGSCVDIPFKTSRYNAFRFFDRALEAFNCSPFENLTLKVFRLNKFIDVGFFVVHKSEEFFK